MHSLHLLSAMHTSHDTWRIVREFADTNTALRMRLISRDLQSSIDTKTEQDFMLLAQLIHRWNRYNYIHTLVTINDLIHRQSALLKLRLESHPALLFKLMFVQIKNGYIITSNFILNKDIWNSSSIIEHFYHFVTSIQDPMSDDSMVIYGQLFGLKLMDNGHNHSQRALKQIRSADICRLISRPRTAHTLSIFDSGILDVICNPNLYDLNQEKMHEFGKMLTGKLVRYWRFKGIPQRLDLEVQNLSVYRRQNRGKWRLMIPFYLQRIWVSHNEYFDNDEYKENLKYLSKFLSWFLKELGFTMANKLDTFSFAVFARSCGLKPLYSKNKNRRRNASKLQKNMTSDILYSKQK